VREAQQPKARRLDATHQTPQLRTESDDMSMRDQIADIIDVGGLLMTHQELADEILAALPDMIPNLAWEYMTERGYWCSQSALGLYECGFDDGWWATLDGYGYWEWEPEEDPRSYSTEFAAQDAANTHHRAAIMAAFTGETQ
jgi:hypothetical protein